MAAGTFAQSDAGRVIYDFEGSTIGRVRFEGRRTDEELVRSVRFLRTRFDDFDFRDDDDIELKRTSYDLHGMFEGAEEVASRLRRFGLDFNRAKEVERANGPPQTCQSLPWTDPDTEQYRQLRETVYDQIDDRVGRAGSQPTYRDADTRDLEYTYLLAKNGANAIHDNESSSMFFIREMKFRRQRHRELAREAEHLGDEAAHWFNWGKNAILDWTAGYGESPFRVICTSGLIVAIFTAVYYLIAPGLYQNPVNFATLSIGSFVTLIVGRVSQVPVASVRLLTTIEAFIGGFLIAMFVFTLTRAIHR